MQPKSNDDQAHPLRVARLEKKLTQQQLADRSGTNRRTIIRTEKGREPLVKTAISLARGVEKTVEDLWGGEAKH